MVTRLTLQTRHRKRKMLTLNRLLVRWEQNLQRGSLKLLQRLTSRLEESNDWEGAIADFEQGLQTFLRHNLEVIVSVFGFEVIDSAKLLHTDLEEKSLFTAFKKRVLEWVKSHAALRSRQIADNMRGRVQRSIAKWIASGKGEREGIKAVADALKKGVALHIAQRIARTEAHTAANKGQQEAAEESGLDMVKEWGATEDARTRPDHAQANGQLREMDEAFDVGGVRLDFPGDPNGPPEQIINCRCVALYWPRTSTGKIIR